MAHLEVSGHCEIYRNTHSNLKSEYVAFPSIQALPDDTLLCMCRHATARESDDGVILIHRSKDGGVTWDRAGQLPEPPDVVAGWRLPGGFAVTGDGRAIACVRYPRSGTGDGQLVASSQDRGDTWSALAPIDNAPFDRMGPGGNLLTMTDGTIVACGEWGEERTDDEPPDWAATITRSHDGARSWEPWRRVQGPADNTYYFDLRLARLADDSLLAAFWTHDMTSDSGLNVHTAVSKDAGETWSEPQDAGVWGQVTDVLGLQSGRVIAVTNHRREPMGVRAVLSDDGGASFDEEHHLELWGIDPARVRSAPVLSTKRDLVEDAFDSYHHFTFGTPSITQLADGTIIVAFYVTEEQVTYVRCCRLVEKG